jgi:uncharacterized protein with FMN-binding domain
MEYSISEVSRLLNITRKTVYSKIEKLEGIHSHIIVRGKHKYIDKTGIELIKNSLISNQSQDVYTTQEDTSCLQGTIETIHKNTSKESDSNISHEYTSMSTQFVSSLQNHIQELSNQLSVKDKQINALTDALETSQKLNENNQILLRESQQRVILLEQSSKSKITWWKKIFN